MRNGKMEKWEKGKRIRKRVKIPFIYKDEM
jgi:hypothetical protein